MFANNIATIIRGDLHLGSNEVTSMSDYNFSTGPWMVGYLRSIAPWLVPTPKTK